MILDSIRQSWTAKLSKDRHVPGFDDIYYQYWYRDVIGFKGGPLAHYLRHGWKEGRDPSAGFSTLGYLKANPDVVKANVCPLVHFWKYGLAEGRVGWQKHPDLPAPKAGVTTAIVKTFYASSGWTNAQIDSTKSKHTSDNIDEANDPLFDSLFQNHLRDDFYGGASEEFLNSREFANAWKEHAWDRTNRFRQHMLPWIIDSFDLHSAEILEIGCGTGAITAVLQPHAKTIRCWEPDAKSLRAARKRAELKNWDNIFFEEGYFTENCEFVERGGTADAVVLVGVIEHVPFDALKNLLRLARHVLKPGGVMIFGDVPNRLSPFDYHTSWMPFYQWLPPNIRGEYFKFSSRVGFVEDIHRTILNCSDYLQEHLQGWGNGVSYHEFEIAFGREVHDWIIADGWDERIFNLAPLWADDQILLTIWEERNVKAHKAFARSWFYLILRPPPNLLLVSDAREEQGVEPSDIVYRDAHSIEQSMLE